jgi:hypothetical protein
MCPACFASIALLLTGAISSGGVAAASIKLFRSKKFAADLSKASALKEKEK